MRHSRKALAGLAAGLCLTAAPLLAQTASYTDITEVTAVEIPVQVVQDGKPVRGLTADDFVVYQDKDRQPITGFDTVDLATLPAGQAAEVPEPARRHFLFLFDLTFSDPKAIVQARTAAEKLLDDLHPSDLAAVATYAASRGPELVIGFTPDRAQVRAAIETLGVPELIDRTVTDPLRIVVDDLKREIEAQTSPEIDQAPPGRAAAKAILLDRLQSFLEESERANRQSETNKVTALAHSLTDLARLMRSVNGRKYVVYLSEGYDNAILTGATDKPTQDDMRKAADEGQFWRVDATAKYGSTSLLSDVESMLQELRRADCIVQAVDIGGLRPAAGQDLGYTRQGGRDSLFQMAHDTGGDLYENFNDLSAAMGQMLERTGVTYVLTIQPGVQPDGGYHPLRVELRKSLRGARVVSRPGYYAPKPFAQRSRYEKMLLTSGQVLMGSEGGPIRTSVLTAALPGSTGSTGSNGTADVAVLIEVEGPSLLHLQQGNDLPVEIYVYALDEHGQVSDFLAQTLALDLLKNERRLLDAGLKLYGHLELPPGRYTARVLVRNGSTGLHGLRVVELDVPAFDSTAPVLLPPLFTEPNGQWLVTREAARTGRRATPLPFRLGDQPYLPAAHPILDGAREARLSLLGYNLGGDLQVKSEILTADGQDMGPGQVAVTERTAMENGTGERLGLTFRPEGLKPGEYLLRVTVTGAGGKAGTTTAPFLIAGG